MRKPISTPSAQAKALCEMIEKHEFHFFVTLATNAASTGKLPFHPSRRYCSNLEATTKLFQAWEARVLHELLGKHWQKCPRRFGTFAVIEKPDLNDHVHCLVQVRADRRSRLYCESLEALHFGISHWRRLCPAGSYDIRDVTDLKPLTEYISKEIRRPEHFDRVILPIVTLH